MARVLWEGAISFGLVHVPVRLYPASSSSALDLDLLDRRTLDPIGYRKVNKRTGKEVTQENIVKGYAHAKGHYVVLGPDELKRANPTAAQTVEILSFVRREEIPPLYFDTPYYLAPGKRGDKVYALLRETMKKLDRVAVATVVIQVKQHLAVLMPVDRMLVLDTLRFEDEIRGTEEFKLPPAGLKAAGVSDQEFKVAAQLVEGMTREWDPSQYHDTYKEDILALVRKKVKAGKSKEVADVEETAPARKMGEVVDLVALLKDSLRRGPRAKKPAERKRA